MEFYSGDENYTLWHGNMLDMPSVIADNSIDAIVTDPPYELDFMNKGWDRSGIAFKKETWEKCLRVLKPGGYMLAFGGSRTFHRIACAVEDAGFEVRDVIMWLYSTGFPKSMSLGKSVEAKLTTGSANSVEFKKLQGTKKKTGDFGWNRNKLEYGARPADYSADEHERTVDVDYQTEEGRRWNGWGTCLKPAYEPIIVARKPCDGSTTDNILKWGVGGINIDECRVETTDVLTAGGKLRSQAGDDRTGKALGMFQDGTENTFEQNPLGRFPANLILSYDETDQQEVCGGMPETTSRGGAMTMPDLRDVGHKSKETIGIDKLSFGQVSNAKRKASGYVAPSDSGSAARYFYCAKASKKDRDEGLVGFEEQEMRVTNQYEIIRADGTMREVPIRKNTHPTVKPTTLMQYLVRLVTPDGGVVLDPFNGSGSTGKAVMFENVERNKGYSYIGIEITEEYLPIAKARIEWAEGVRPEDIADEAPEEDGKQLTVWDLFG